MRSFDLVIFDMDGTLVDTELIASQAMAQGLRDEFDIDIDAHEMADRYRGWYLQPVLEDLTQRYSIKTSPEFMMRVDEKFHDLIETELEATAGVDQCLKQLSGEVLMSIASNSSREILDHYIRRLDWAHIFDMDRNVFSSDDVTKGKPSPEMFQLAAERFNIEPARCIVLEDSATGAMGGLAAGMTVVGFTGNHPESFAHLDDLKLEIIDDITTFPDLVLR